MADIQKKYKKLKALYNAAIAELEALKKKPVKKAVKKAPAKKVVKKAVKRIIPRRRG